MPFIIPINVPAGGAPSGTAVTTTPVGVTPGQITLPHFAAPFHFDATGKPNVVQQDSADDVAACVFNVLACPQGGKLDDPTFGIPTPLFDNFPVDFGPALAAVQALEPRAEVDALTQVLNNFNPGEVDVQLIIQALTQAENT